MNSQTNRKIEIMFKVFDFIALGVAIGLLLILGFGFYRFSGLNINLSRVEQIDCSSEDEEVQLICYEEQIRRGIH